MNLIEDAWIPVRRRSGKIESITPWQLTDGFSTDPFVQVAAPRPDFSGALVQFLIGLLQTQLAPEDVSEWRRKLRQPPVAEELKAAFKDAGSSFQLDGEGPRFLQDLNLEREIAVLDSAAQEDRTKCVGDLLVNIPTGKTLRDNTDLFVKRGLVDVLCPACAAAALITMQINAPSGGQGHRTGIRGGGPLTTLVLGDSLWATCWLNVLAQREFLATSGNPAKNSPADRFPWLAPTRTSEEGRGTTPEDCHPTQVFWAMPRRVRLVFFEEEATCDICSKDAMWVVRQCLTKNLGINYTGPWRHPLSPHYIQTDGEPSCIHPQSGGIGYRHWLGLVQSFDGDKAKREPAAVVRRYLQIGGEDLRLWVFGYEMDNMKVRSWCDSSIPLLICPAEICEDFAFRVGALVSSAELTGREICEQLNRALFKAQKDRKGKEKKVKRDLSFVSGRFWQETEPGFYWALLKVRSALQGAGDVTATMESWHRLLVHTAEHIFDGVSQTGAFEAADPRRIALAWRDLQKALGGRKMRQSLGLH
ncbi:MAG TPA: type I-E CRISPR-associated protein Cse1/CasA [Verrucomicrobiota bacterium]|nr:type I-E CRISPR-associated protein Cse1/CasA [Verrucomicrobiota bacterium]